MTQTMLCPYHIADLLLSSGLHAFFILARRVSATDLQSFMLLSRNNVSLLLQMYLLTLLTMAPLALSVTLALSPSFLHAGCRLRLMPK